MASDTTIISYFTLTILQHYMLLAVKSTDYFSDDEKGARTHKHAWAETATVPLWNLKGQAAFLREYRQLTPQS